MPLRRECPPQYINKVEKLSKCIEKEHCPLSNLDMIGSNMNFGVQIDSELKWREHILFAIGKISRAIGMLKYAKKYLPLEIIKKHVYKCS